MSDFQRMQDFSSFFRTADEINVRPEKMPDRVGKDAVTESARRRERHCQDLFTIDR